MIGRRRYREKQMVGQCEGQAVDAANLRQEGEALYAPPSLSYRKVRRGADLIRRPEGSSKVREANFLRSELFAKRTFCEANFFTRKNDLQL